MEKVHDYPEALMAIVAVMIHALNLPPPHGRVFVFSDIGAYQSAISNEIKQRLSKSSQKDGLDPRAAKIKKYANDFDIFKVTVEQAFKTSALGMHHKVFIAEWTVKDLAWPERVRILAHELTHVIENEVADGHVESMDIWLKEGFANWISFKVLEALGSKNSFDRLLAEAKAKGIPNLKEMATARSWMNLERSRGRATAYGQATTAVDYLIARQTMASVVEYFRLFKNIDDPEQNFRTAFGEPVAAFDTRLQAQLTSAVEYK